MSRTNGAARQAPSASVISRRLSLSAILCTIKAVIAMAGQNRRMAMWVNTATQKTTTTPMSNRRFGGAKTAFKKSQRRRSESIWRSAYMRTYELQRTLIGSSARNSAPTNPPEPTATATNRPSRNMKMTAAVPASTLGKRRTSRSSRLPYPARTTGARMYEASRPGGRGSPMGNRDPFVGDILSGHDAGRFIDVRSKAVPRRPVGPETRAQQAQPAPSESRRRRGAHLLRMRCDRLSKVAAMASELGRRPPRALAALRVQFPATSQHSPSAAAAEVRRRSPRGRKVSARTNASSSVRLFNSLNTEAKGSLRVPNPSGLYFDY